MLGCKCPNCGSAVVGESRFCNYCGAKIPDDVQRSEIKIEDVAGIARVEFEREQAAKQEVKEEKARKRKRNKSIVKLAIVAALGIGGYIAYAKMKYFGTIVLIYCGCFALILLVSFLIDYFKD